jgi:hypothetical protein
LDTIIRAATTHKSLKEKSNNQFKDIDFSQRNHSVHSPNEPQAGSSTNKNQSKDSSLSDMNLQLVPVRDLSNPTSYSSNLDQQQQQQQKQSSGSNFSDFQQIDQMQHEFVSKGPANFLRPIEASSIQSNQQLKELGIDFDVDNSLEERELQFSYDHIVCDSEEDMDSNVDTQLI